MNPTEKLIVRELNRLSEEVFRQYYLGKYQDAIRHATFVLQRAKEKLGQWHPNLQVYYDNLQLVKNAQKMFESGRLDNNNSIENRKALQHAIKTFGANHPYIDELKEEFNLTSLDGSSRLKDLAFKKYIKKLIIIASIIISIFVIFIISLITKNISLPSFKIGTIGSFFQNVFEKEYSYELKEQVLIDAPLILQKPELPRGCEVTSLAMLLQYSGIDADKMTLAKKVTKDTTPYQYLNGKIYFGNPDYGFVGDMYSLRKPGLGVYHGPVKDLADDYLPNQIIDLTGRPFEDIYYFLSNEIPVWVIINTQFVELGEEEFHIWYTEYGPIQITYKQHSVLLTGYDEQYVYFNDPLNSNKNVKVPKESFKKAWEQMGRQAISYVPEDMDLIEILPID